jgi:hypothetical protein
MELSPSSFSRLSTVKFQEAMKPYATAIYERLFTGGQVEYLPRDGGVRVHILDQEFGVDLLLRLLSGQWISIQEKYRRYEYLKYMDFTMEFKNAVGTKYESPGEWFKLGAQMYFYAWANRDLTGLEKWVLLDIPRLKVVIERGGGIERIGTLHNNIEHGRASFYSIPILNLKDAFLKQHGILLS